MDHEIFRKGVFFGILFLLVIGPINHPGISEKISTRTLITVDDEPGDADYTSIQDAIDNASTNDIIYVYSGTYENIQTRKRVTLKGIPYELADGNDTGKPIIKESELQKRSDSLIRLVEANDCLIEGFDLIAQEEKNGILLMYSSNNILRENNISGCMIGIQVECVIGPSCNNTIEKNIIFNNHDGILIEHAQNNTIRNNIITHNIDSGIVVYSAEGNTIVHNFLSENGHFVFWIVSWAGVLLIQASNTIVENNCFEDNLQGIFIASATHTIVRYNNFFGDIRKEAYAAFTFSTLWENNYWKRPRITAKPISVILFLIPISFPPYDIPIHGIQFDWHPAQKPYDIPRI